MLTRLRLLLLISAMTLIVFFAGIWLGDRDLYNGALTTGTVLSVLVMLFATDVRVKEGK